MDLDFTYDPASDITAINDNVRTERSQLFGYDALAEQQAICDGTTPTLGTGTFYLHADHLGRPQFATDSDGAVVWDMGDQVTPFGQSVNLAGAFAQKLMFPGQYADEETGDPGSGSGTSLILSHNWHRTYDPTLGRYLQSDPIGLAGGLNRYAYVGGNPMGYFDEIGLSAASVPRGAYYSAVGPTIKSFIKKAWKSKNVAAGAAIFGYSLGAVGRAIYEEEIAPIFESTKDDGCDMPVTVPVVDSEDQDQDEDCDAEWDRAYAYCDDLFRNGVPSSHKNIGGGAYMRCVMGQVAERCGGNKVEH